MSKFRTSVELDTEAMAINVSVVNKESDEVVGSESFAAGEIHESLRNQVALYGYSKLLQDRSSDTPTGPEKLTAMAGVAAQIASGQWAKERKIGAIVVSANVEALARLKSCTVAQAQAALKAYSKEDKAKIFANPKIVELAAAIEAERKDAESVDLGDLADL